MTYIQILAPIALGFVLYFIAEYISVKGLMTKLRYDNPTLYLVFIGAYIGSFLLISLLVNDIIYPPFLAVLSLTRLFSAFYFWGDVDTIWKVFTYTFIAEGVLVALSPIFVQYL